MMGYNPEFLGTGKLRIDIPWINYELFADVLKREELRDNYIADYLHYSVIMSRRNRQAYLSACNLDQSKYRSVGGRYWKVDSRIGAENQLDNRYYMGEENLWDRGHLTRRTAVTWGESDYIARQASNGSCSYANACLQHRDFNEDEWRIPERIAEQFDRDLNGLLSIMTGPLFTEYDRWFEPKDYDVPPGRIPAGFWKIIYYVDKKKTAEAGEEVLGCEAYLIYQDELSLRDDSGAERLDLATLQVTISELADLTGLVFPEPLYDANPLWYHPADDRDITEPERYEIKTAVKSKGVKKDWAGHVIHDRDDIEKHGFKRVSA